MAMKLPTPPTQAPSRTLPRTSGSLSIALLRILARPLGDSASPAISGTTFERSRMPPLESMIPGFSRPRGPKRTSFMDSPRAEGAVGIRGKGSCVGCPRRARKCAQLWAEWGQDNQRFGRVCPQRGLGAAYLLPIGNRRQDIGQTSRFRGVFICNRNLPRTGLPHGPSPRAKLQVTRVRGPTQWQVPSSGLCRVIWFNWGVRRGRREPASFAFGPSHGSREYAAIDEKVLPG